MWHLRSGNQSQQLPRGRLRTHRSKQRWTMEFARQACSLAIIAVVVVGAQALRADQQVIAVQVPRAPVIDGYGDDDAWSRAEAVTTMDVVAEVPLTLKAVHSEKRVYFLVSYPDTTENRQHKTMFWDAQAGIYRMGPEREDMFVFKWSMEPRPVDLSVIGQTPYKADIWFWKAFRTDHAGYADDKTHVYTMVPMRQAKRVFSQGGQIFYLRRSGDEGQAAYHALLHERYSEPRVPRYEWVTPRGSRADVHAKGEWRDGRWTIEFGRSLETGQLDDVQFDPSLTYQFGVSRYEMAGRERDPAVEQPDYGRGDVGESLTLIFR
jgi:hypothetical protein